MKNLKFIFALKCDLYAWIEASLLYSKPYFRRRNKVRGTMMMSRKVQRSLLPRSEWILASALWSITKAFSWDECETAGRSKGKGSFIKHWQEQSWTDPFSMVHYSWTPSLNGKGHLWTERERERAVIVCLAKCHMHAYNNARVIAKWQASYCSSLAFNSVLSNHKPRGKKERGRDGSSSHPSSYSIACAHWSNETINSCVVSFNFRGGRAPEMR